MKFFKVFLFILACSTVGHSQSSIAETLKKFNSESVPYIYVKDLALAEQSIVLDAREKEEFLVSHLKNAIWVGHKTFRPKTVLSQVKDKNKPIIVYCSVGVRSEDIGEKLMELGYSNIKNLYGGIFEWKNQGYPVFDSNGEETDKIHAFSKQWGELLTNGIKVL
ncbi:MAG: rhodanese-like domain-containing protein [Bacteroidota bacterium]